MKGKGRKILFAICVIVAGIAIGYLILYYTKLVKNEKKYDEVVKEVVKEEVKKEPQEDAYTSPIDFKKLQEQNPDVYAWIEIPGTNVNIRLCAIQQMMRITWITRLMERLGCLDRFIQKIITTKNLLILIQ